MVGLPNFRLHSKSGPFATKPLFDYLKSTLVRISDPHCNGLELARYSNGDLKNRQKVCYAVIKLAIKFSSLFRLGQTLLLYTKYFSTSTKRFILPEVTGCSNLLSIYQAVVHQGLEYVLDRLRNDSWNRTNFLNLIVARNILKCKDNNCVRMRQGQKAQAGRPNK